MELGGVGSRNIKRLSLTLGETRKTQTLRAVGSTLGPNLFVSSSIVVVVPLLTQGAGWRRLVSNSHCAVFTLSCGVTASVRSDNVYFGQTRGMFSTFIYD